MTVMLVGDEEAFCMLSDLEKLEQKPAFYFASK